MAGRSCVGECSKLLLVSRQRLEPLWHVITSQENCGQTQTYSRKAKQNRSKTESVSLVIWLFCCFVSSKFVVKCIGVIKFQGFMYVGVCVCVCANWDT